MDRRLIRNVENNYPYPLAIEFRRLNTPDIMKPDYKRLKQILKIDIQTGKVAERVSTNEELGNLVCYGDNILSQSSQWVSSYYQRTPLREKVASQLKDNPNDEWALARQCELLLQDGRKDAALEVLEIDDVAFSPIATGMGMVRSAHGMIPNPAPATVELLIDVLEA